MSSKRRSSRAKKSVSYIEQDGTKENGLKYGSDDDFEIDFAPPPKKAKVKDNNVKNNSKSIEVEKSSPNERPSLDQKLYQRNIEKALQLSLDNCKPLAQKDQGKAEEVSHTESTNPSKDQDYHPPEETETEDDDDADEEADSDFDEENESRSTPKSEKRKQVVTKQNQNVHKNGDILKKQSPISKPKTTVKQIPEENRRINNSEATTSLVKLKRSPLNAVGRKWSTLGLGGVVIKNPGPPIRVGLSRNTKVKPLHLNVAVTR